MSRADYYQQTLLWASRLRFACRDHIELTVAALTAAYKEDLSEYFRLGALARSLKAPSELSTEATGLLFKCRTVLEKSLHDTLLCGMKSADERTFVRPRGTDRLMAGLWTRHRLPVGRTWSIR